MALDADLITLMRAALLHTQDPGAYEKLMALESNKGSKVLTHSRRGHPVDRDASISPTMVCLTNSMIQSVLKVFVKCLLILQNA